MKNSADKVAMLSLDDLLGCASIAQPSIYGSPAYEKEKIVYMPLDEMHDFKDHPFRVLDDAKMAETVDSIKKNGVLVPGIVRPRPAGGYETIAGHRRRRACELAGKMDMPVIIRDLTDHEATVIMVDSNIQREDLLPSEKAKAYKMKYEAMKCMGILDQGGRNDKVLAEQSGESRNTIQRYIRLTHLVPVLLDMVDSRKLGFTIAVDLSYLDTTSQKLLLQIMESGKVIPNGQQAAELKEYSKKKELTRAVMELVLAKNETSTKVTISSGELSKYFPENYTKLQMEEVIYKLLEEWKSGTGNKL